MRSRSLSCAKRAGRTGVVTVIVSNDSIRTFQFCLCYRRPRLATLSAFSLHGGLRHAHPPSVPPPRPRPRRRGPAACRPSAVRRAVIIPSRPIKIIVPFAAGGGPDVLTRKMAVKLAEVLGKGSVVVVENIVGAGGILAAQSVARMAPDGYNLLLGASSHIVQKAMEPERQVRSDEGLRAHHSHRLQSVDPRGQRDFAVHDGGRPRSRPRRRSPASSTTPPAASAARPT